MRTERSSASPDDATSIATLTLEEFVAATSRRSAAPGGGAAAAVCTSLAASLVAMAARYATGLAAADETAARCDAMAKEALQLADRDGAGYAHFLAVRAAASREPNPTQNDAVVAARRETADVPLRICELAVAAARFAADFVREGRPSLVGDALTAALLAEAAASSCAALVEIDLGDAPGDARRAKAAALLREVHDVVDSVRPQNPATDRR